MIPGRFVLLCSSFFVLVEHFRERLTALAQVFTDIQRDDVFTHGWAEKVSGLESVSSIENCLVALTACGRCGGI